MSEDFWIAVIPQAITVVVPALVTIITTMSVKKQANKHSARSSILQLILEDHVRVSEGKLPENYLALHHEYDEYKKSGGNSYVENKVKDYDEWYRRVSDRKS